MMMISFPLRTMWQAHVCLIACVCGFMCIDRKRWRRICWRSLTSAVTLIVLNMSTVFMFRHSWGLVEMQHARDTRKTSLAILASKTSKNYMGHFFIICLLRFLFHFMNEGRNEEGRNIHFF